MGRITQRVQMTWRAFSAGYQNKVSIGALLIAYMDSGALAAYPAQIDLIVSSCSITDFLVPIYYFKEVSKKLFGGSDVIVAEKVTLYRYV